MERTHQNGTLGLSHVGLKVSLVGWVAKKRNLGSLLFIDLRDRSGIVQVLVNDPTIVTDIRNEYVISVTGTVRAKEVINKNLATGSIEVVADHILVINKALTPPMIIDDNTDALEEVRLAYRYLDLRRPVMQKNLIIRSQIVRSFHEFLDKEGFLEIETPMLSLSTPGGARDYLVPSRLQHGSFYALPQSPQIYKQLLMIAGFERYYQVARCFRDEDLRADRQPDFTQIDIETSFLDQDQLLSLLEKGLSKVFHDVKNITINLPLRRMTYEQAVTTYGSDKPDTRYDLKFTDLKEIFSHSTYEPFIKERFVKGFVVRNQAGGFSRKLSDDLALEGKKFDIKNLIVLKMTDGQLIGSFTKMLKPEEVTSLISKLKLKNDDVLVMTSGSDFKKFHFFMGAIRTILGRTFKLIDTASFDLLWVTDFPLFEEGENGQLVSSHHAFTRPREEDLKYLNTEPTKVLAQAFDLVLNGNEAGGGSMRIYNRDTQYRIFELLGMSKEDIQKKFGWFIEAFNYGTPPHGGVAFGLDRLTMIFAGVDNIRDVIAFPKNLSAVGPLEKTPAPVEPKQLEELGLIIKEKK